MAPSALWHVAPAFRGRLLFARSPKSNEEPVRQGTAPTLMSTLCGTNASTYCLVWFPRSAEEVPQGIWPTDGSLKLSARDKPSSPEARPIPDGVLWTLLKIRHRKKQE